jgi:hypothetical protein
MKRFQGGNLDLNLKALVVADEATRSRILDNYLKQNGDENTAALDHDNLPQAIFWLKKKVGLPDDRSK